MITIEPVELIVSLTGHYYNHWPNLKILHNNIVVFDGQIIDGQILKLNLNCSLTNILKFVHYGKQFGENGVWDSNSDASEQCFINIKDIKFNQVSIGEKLKAKLIFKTNWTELQRQHNTQEFIDTYSTTQCYGSMNFNGEIELKFNTPVYDWLILSKYKEPLADTEYFSNHSARWHYEKDLKIIKEIKELISFDKNSNT